SGSSTICDGAKITLSVAQADQYTWSTGATTQSIEVTQAGNYSVNVRDNALGCNSSSSIFSVVVNPSPISQFHVEGELRTLNLISFVNGSSGATSYQWTFGDGLNSI